MIQVREIAGLSGIGPFVDLPYRLYRKEKYWVPPIRRMEMAQFDPASNPALEHAEYKLWVAEKDGRIAGRIGCFINDMETQMRGQKQARFNWLEFEDDPEISSLLLNQALEWAKSKGAALLKGPLGFTNFEGAGMTVEGYEELGTMGAAFHFPYYRQHLENAGFGKLVDYVEYVVETVPDGIPPKLERLRPIIEQKFGIRKIEIGSKAELEKRARDLFHLVMDTYSGLPSFVPLSEKQVDHYVAQNLPFLLTDYLPLLEDQHGNIVGYGVMIPSFSRALQRANGKLYPFGFLHLLWTRRYHQTVDLILIGVVEEWRNKGLNAIIFGNTIPVFNRRGVNRVFINPILEDNQASLSLFKDYDPRIFRRRRVFVKPLPH
ncbi:MAG: hypothetical protein IPH04_13235 [Saprospirales bacterium]|nr:hypothetical protein [Saprospirales bacterium]